jgi:murein DD-endopeptidase MepM/ murein hydrolase activator NlpD
MMGAIATVAALVLFIYGESQPRDDIAAADEYYAGSRALGLVEEPEYEAPAPPSISISVTLDRTETAEYYLREAGLDRAEARRWAALFRHSAGTRLMHRGHPLTLYKDPGSGDLRGLRYDLDSRKSVMLVSLGESVVKASSESIKYVVRPVRVSFEVKSNFRRAAARNGVPRPIVESLENAFADRHDLDKLRPGAGVKLIYREKISHDGSYHLADGIEAAQIQFGGRTLEALAFRDEHGGAHLYDAEGHVLGLQSLRFPVHFKYISSGFTYHRYHPILHEYRPHLGVDLVAPYGTPVKAIADGRVQTASWCGELGECVRIDHSRGMVSIYGHLSRISRDARAGAFVRMGEVIGYVGSTGLSTGPHLHFALEKHGSYVNPLTQKLGVNHRVSPRMKALFDAIRARYIRALAQLPDLGSRFVPADARKPAISPLADLYHVTLRRPAERTRGYHHWRRRWSARGSRATIAPVTPVIDAASGAM